MPETAAHFDGDPQAGEDNVDRSTQIRKRAPVHEVPQPAVMKFATQRDLWRSILSRLRLHSASGSTRTREAAVPPHSVT
jgi:hypothetical protein